MLLQQLAAEVQGKQGRAWEAGCQKKWGGSLLTTGAVAWQPGGKAVR